MRIKKWFYIVISVFCVNGYAQFKMDVSALPKGNYTERYWSLDRWGSKMGNIITVQLRTDSLGNLTFRSCLIETTISKDIPTYILFPSSGTETDIFIYEFREDSSHTIEIGDSVLKKNIIMMYEEDTERAIRIDDLKPGYYYVSYQSCNYGGAYILWIREKSTP